MTRKQRNLIKARLAEVARKHERQQGYQVYRHGVPAYRRQPAKASIVDEVLFVTLAMLVVVLIISV